MDRIVILSIPSIKHGTMYHAFRYKYHEGKIDTIRTRERKFTANEFKLRFRDNLVECINYMRLEAHLPVPNTLN